MAEAPGKDAALLLAESAQAALEEAISTSPQGRGREQISEVIKALASAGAVDQILTSALGAQVAIVLKVLLPLLATYLEPDPKTIQRIESKLDVLIESPLRAGLDVFQRALNLPAEDKGYRESRLRDAQQSFDEAYGRVQAQKARRILTESEWLQAKVRLNLLRAFCAASRAGGYEEALGLAQEPLKLLEDAERDYRKNARDRRREQDNAFFEARALQEAKDNYHPSLDTQTEYHLQKDGLEDFRKDNPTYPMSPLAEYEWYMEEADRVISELESAARKEHDLEEMYESEAEQCRGISNLIKGALLELSRT